MANAMDIQRERDPFISNLNGRTCLLTWKSQQISNSLQSNLLARASRVTLEENEGFCNYKEQLVLGCIEHL